MRQRQGGRIRGVHFAVRVFVEALHNLLKDHFGQILDTQGLEKAPHVIWCDEPEDGTLVSRFIRRNHMHTAHSPLEVSIKHAEHVPDFGLAALEFTRISGAVDSLWRMVRFRLVQRSH